MLRSRNEVREAAAYVAVPAALPLDARAHGVRLSRACSRRATASSRAPRAGARWPPPCARPTPPSSRTARGAPRAGRRQQGARMRGPLPRPRAQPQSARCWSGAPTPQDSSRLPPRSACPPSRAPPPLPSLAKYFAMSLSRRAASARERFAHTEADFGVQACGEAPERRDADDDEEEETDAEEADEQSDERQNARGAHESAHIRTDLRKRQLGDTSNARPKASNARPRASGPRQPRTRANSTTDLPSTAVSRAFMAAPPRSFPNLFSLRPFFLRARKKFAEKRTRPPKIRPAPQTRQARNRTPAHARPPAARPFSRRHSRGLV